MAKMIKFNLTLSGATVSTFDELQDNFSAEILPIYRTGRLLKWLQARELTEQVQAVQAITPSDDDRELLGALCRAVGLDDDAEVLTFLLEDWQVSQQSQAAQAATAPDTTTANSAATSADENEDQEETHAHSGTTVDWSGQDMTGRNFEGEDFSHGKFVGTNFSNSNLDGVNFSGADLSGAIFGDKCQTRDAKFVGANLKGVVFHENGRFDRCDFSKADLTDTHFHGCMDLANFIDAKFHKTIFRKASLENANFTNAELKNMDFTECNLYMINFDSADLSFSAFSEVSFALNCRNSPAHWDSRHFRDYRALGNDNARSANFKNAKLTGVTGLTRARADQLTSVYKKELDSKNSNLKTQSDAEWPFK